MPSFIFDASIPQQPDFGRTPSQDVVTFLQQHLHRLGGAAEPAADADKHYGISQSLVQPSVVLTEGIIKYALPAYGSYRVALYNLGGVIRARNGMNAAEGASDVSVLPIGTHVVVAVNPITSLGTIVAIIPLIQGEAADAFCDFVVQGSGTGLYCSPHYLDYLSRTADAAAALPYSGDRPLDGLPGDWTVMSPTGVGVHADTEMAYLRTSELCGLFLFREDGHTRLSGESLATESLSVRSDSGLVLYESYSETQHIFYPWEAVGQTQPGGIELNQLGPAAIYAGSVASLEPANPDVMPIARLVTYGGYLGQGQLTILSTPVGDGENRLSNPVESRGLFREQVMVDGTYLVESARQMLFVKATDIPVLRRTASREQPPEEPYRFSGEGIQGPEHKVSQLHSGDPIADAVGISDLYAYTSAWQGLHAAVYHPGVEVKYPAATSSFSPSLDGTDRIEPPEPEQVRIDQRYGDVDIYRVLSLFVFLPDGTVVLRSGLGGEVRISSIVEVSGTAFYVNAAKTISLLAGQIAVRAQQSVEIVSSLASVSIKGERNVTVLGGNSGHGGVLIESRAVGPNSQWPAEVEDAAVGGVMIKSSNAVVGIYGGELLLQTGPTAAGSQNGRIIIDAPQNAIIMRSLIQHSYATSYYDHFGTHPDRVSRTNLREAGNMAISGSLRVSEQIVGGGSVQIRDNYSTSKGHYASVLSDTPTFRGKVGVEKYPDRIDEELKKLGIRLREASDSGQQMIDTYRDTLQAENRPGNPETIKAATFGFRSSEAYGASNVTLVQPYWQQLFPSGASWREPIVKYRGTEPTRPWPGNARWEDPAGYREVDGESVYFDKLRQRPIDPTDNRETYETITPPTVRNVSIQSGLKTVFIS